MINPNLLPWIILFSIILFIYGYIYILKSSNDGFNGSKISKGSLDTVRNVHKALPPINPEEIKKGVHSAIEGIHNLIDERPEIVDAIRQVLKDPKIHETLMNVVFDTSEASSFSLSKYL